MNTHIRRSRLVGLALALALMAILAAACGSSSHKSATSASTALRSTTTAAPPASSAPPGGALETGALSELTGFFCAPDANRAWSASGTLHNSHHTTEKYNVQLSVASRKTSTVVAQVVKNFTVAASQSEKLDIKSFYQGSVDGLTCTVHVTRADA